MKRATALSLGHHGDNNDQRLLGPPRRRRRCSCKNLMSRLGLKQRRPYIIDHRSTSRAVAAGRAAPTAAKLARPPGTQLPGGAIRVNLAILEDYLELRRSARSRRWRRGMSTRGLLQGARRLAVVGR